MRRKGSRFVTLPEDVVDLTPDRIDEQGEPLPSEQEATPRASDAEPEPTRTGING